MSIVRFIDKIDVFVVILDTQTLFPRKQLDQKFC